MTEFEPLGDAADRGWQWVLLDGAGVVIGPSAVAFSDQDAAEEWLSAHFQDLVEDGATAVSLRDGERLVYGPMSLAPDEDSAGDSLF